MKCILSFPPHITLEGEGFSYPYFAGEERGHREVKEFTQGHTASECSSQDLHWDLSVSRSYSPNFPASLLPLRIERDLAGFL